MSWRYWPYLVLVVFAAVVIAARMFAPSDIHQDADQAKTMAFTADMVVNGQWFLPRDQLGQMSNKPPLVNWVGSPLAALGFWDEWSLKFPSLLGGCLTVVMVTWMGRRLARRIAGGIEADGTLADWAGVLCGLAYMANSSFVKHVYFIRPDMLNVTFLTAAWIAATMALEESCRRRRLWAMGFWLAIGAAALTKGTMALTGVVYALTAARLIHGRFAAIHRLSWWWGLPLAMVMVGSWLGAAYMVNAQHVTEQLLGVQTVGRIVGEGGVGPWVQGVGLGLWTIVGGFVERFAPWAVVVMVALFVIRPRQWFSHAALGPAILWVLTIMVCLVPVAGKGPSYLMPAYPAAACVAVIFLLRGWANRPVPVAWIMATAIVVATLGCTYQYILSSSARTGSGDVVKAFAREVGPIIGDDAVVFVRVRHTPIISLLGRHQAGAADASALDEACWVIRIAEPQYAKDRAWIDKALVKTRLFQRTKGYLGGVDTVLVLTERVSQ
jgi:4-amino-4-deoxy-L-arabinose transferase-like glycosyltransferase